MVGDQRRSKIRTKIVKRKCDLFMVKNSLRIA
jgi:hypothetical protein